MYTGHALDIEGFITIGDIIIGFGMMGAIYGSEATMIFLFKGLTPVIILHFSILTMLEMTYNYRNCKVAFLDCYQYSCCNQ